MDRAVPPPLTEDSFARVRRAVDLHDHVVCVYDRHEDLIPGLRAFVEDGLAAGETVVFIHSMPRDEEAWSLLDRATDAVRAARTGRLVLVSLYRDAFEAEAARIDYAHVERVVGALVDAAAREGRRGVRIFVDASRVYFGAGRTDEWFAFEAWLGRRLQASVGLVCAYTRASLRDPRVLADALRTHAYRFDVL